MRIVRPTNDQAQSCLRVCQMLSNGDRDIKLFRFNPEKGYVFVMAGDNLQIMVFPSGLWRFIDET
ncbi:MAG: hypothetical protein GDA56_02805 [Hormoscilla sp. GM7CHS1pb]|nr:hypothetical protein [Hormoscilla sp. GM7CHS1pb]